MNLLRFVLIVTICIFCPFWLWGNQVVHVENKRLMSHEDGWSGSIDFELEWTQSTEEVFNGLNTLQAEYTTGKNVFLLLNDIEWLRVQEQNVLLNGYQHLRHNYRITDRFSWEALAQTQFNEPYQLEFRGLLGTGPRYGFIQREKVLLFAGTTYLYEMRRFEGVDDSDFAHRSSTYLSFTYLPAEDLTFNFINYFQPRFSDFSKHRVSGSVNVVFEFRKWLSFIAEFSYFYDNELPETVPNEFYSLTNGIRIDF